MSSIIKKIKIQNFRRFQNYSVYPNAKMNILVGDNEVGKSSILEAIDLVSSGNIRKIEAIGIDKLLNADVVQQFNSGERTITNLPIMIIELFLEGNFDQTMSGKNNTDHITCDGIRLVCEPNIDYSSEIADSLQANKDYFPYDYYSVRFSTFADEAYSGYKKKLRTILIDSTNMSSEYATNDYIKRMYNQYTEDNTKERALHRSKYRQLKSGFRTDSLSDLNGRIPAGKNYSFGLKTGSSSCLENDLMIYENEVGIDNKGTGRQVFIKTDFALDRSGSNIDVIMIEEPENHLSPTNLRKLVQRVSDTQNGQIFVTTHNSLISTRLELQNLLIMHHDSNESPTSLSELTLETAKYFMKAPVANMIEFSLSSKVILVEGPSEYMLFERFYETIAQRKPESDDVRIMDVRGLSFKRYLETAMYLKSKVAVVTDNDGNKQSNCIDKYTDFAGINNIKIFYETNETLNTFEKVLFEANKELCTNLFAGNSVDYMLSNKTEAAYILLNQETTISVPDYIRRAIEWINE